MSQRNWETILDVYIYDHLVRKKLHNTANSFMAEGKVSPDPVAIGTPGGLLFAWWSMFWDIYNAKTKDKHAVEYGLNVYIYDYLVKKKLLYTAKTFMSEVKVSPDHVVIDTPGGYLFAWWSVFWAFFIARTNEKHFESAAEAQLGKEKEQMKQPNSRNTETFQPLMDAGTIHHGQMVHGKYQGGVLSELQQLQSPTQQTVENKSEVNLWASPRQLPVDPSTVHGQGILQSKPGIGSAGLNPGVGAHPLKGWPFTVQKAFLQNQGQFQLSPQQQQQQQIMAQVQGQGNMTSSPMYGDMDPRRFTGLPRENLNSTDGQQNANSSKLINMPPVQQSYSQQDPLLSQQNNSTWTTNTVGPSNSQPSTPSTHTPNEGIAITGNMQHVNNMPMMYDYDAIGGLASSANQLDDMEPFGNVGALEDDLEPVFFLDDEFVESVIDILNWNPSEFIEPQPNPMNTETSQPHVDPRMALLKSGTTYHGEMVQGNHQEGGVSASLQQLIPLEAGEGESRKGRCTCKMSKCLQLNCECFAAGFYCSTEPPCSCIDCFNKPIHEATVASKTPASARGCNCKKSNCQKKYCGCFQGGVGCSIQCRCEGCKNTFGRKPLASV